MASEALTKLLALAEQLPKGIQSDWDGTNHYEMHAPYDENIWWLDLRDVFFRRNMPSPCQTEDGKRVGLLMDIAGLLKKCEGELRELVARLPKEIDDAPITEPVYVKVCEGEISTTKEYFGGMVVVDVDKNGSLIGVEILNG